MVCTPSTQFCLLNSVMQCNEEGSGMTTLQGCTEEEICKEGVCVENAICGGIQCPELPGYDISCNSRDFCEYTNPDATGWKAWDVWIYVPPGSFSMGSPASEEGRGTDEGPVHTVTFAYGFFIAKYETVVQQYEACRAASPTLCTAPSTADWTAGTWGTNTSEIGRMTHPQNGLTWQQAKNVCAWLAADGRLPSEAEWEYAAKGPSHKKFPWGDAPAPTCSNGTAVFNQAQMSTTGGCGSGGTWPVGSKALGLSWTGALDTSGNVWEWCEDKYNSNYVGAPVDGTPWVDTGVSRTIRGGGFNDSAVTMRSAQRYLPGLPPSHRSAHMGVRCVRPEPSRQ
jgi:formylglycine-generating enzyme required for sulfatase activity